ncbi:hypothetical protein VPH35_000700 [Triticum aestivum]
MRFSIGLEKGESEHGWGGDRSGEGFGAGVGGLGGETPSSLAPSARLGRPAGLRICWAAAAGIGPFASLMCHRGDTAVAAVIVVVITITTTASSSLLVHPDSSLCQL